MITVVCVDNSTRVLCDLPLCNHLFALWIHQLTVFVLFQTLKNVPGVGLGAETLQGCLEVRS